MKEQGRAVSVGHLCWEFLCSVLGKIFFPGNSINLSWHRMGGILYPKQQSIGEQTLSAISGMRHHMDTAFHYVTWKAVSQTHSVTEVTGCSILSCLSCVSHSRVAEVIAHLCWFLRCHRRSLYRIRQTWVRGQEGLVVDGSTGSLLLPWFLPLSPLSVPPANKTRSSSLPSHKWVLGCVSSK